MSLSAAFSLADKRLIITGAGSGMGRKLAQLAVEDGATVAVLDVNEEGLKETADQIGDAGRVLAVPADVTDWTAVKQAVSTARGWLGGVDGVANFVGWDCPGRFSEQPLELWHKLVDINLWGALHVARAVAPVLIEQGSASLVFLSSDAGRVGSKGETVYAACKGGIIALTKSLARELAPHGVRVNCVCPGPTMTPLFDRELEDNPKLFERMLKSIPLRRYGEVDDQASAVAFLLSSASSYMTGQLLSVSGGLTMAG
jgi:2-hydroxycyclohexanecarboxyl-CoA dehydrogenase